jgi:CRP-like cAMP-binding protein
VQEISVKRYSTGEIVYKEGAPCNHVYFIKSGEVELSVLCHLQTAADYERERYANFHPEEF